MTSTRSTVTMPSPTISSRTGRIRSICSAESTISITTGRSSDSRRMRAVKERIRAEALDASEYRGPREALLANALDDRLVERLAVPAVGLAEEDPQKLPFALDLHQSAL